MSAEMKYVVVRSPNFGEQLVVFPSTINHDAMAEALSLIRHGPLRNWTRPDRLPISAGFTDGLNCYGRSESLNLDSRIPADTLLLKMGGAG